MRHGGRSSTTIRILLFVDNFDIGGTQSQFIRLANALARDASYEVDVACLKGDGALRRTLELPPDRITTFALRRFYDAHGLRQILRLARQIRTHCYDLIHAHDFYANVMCAAASCISRSRLVVSRRYLRLSERTLHDLGERWSYRLADTVVLNSQLVARELMRNGILTPQKTVIIPNGIELERFTGYEDPNVSRREGACRLGVVASLVPDKDHETLIRATATLRTRWPDIELVLVGDGHLRPVLQALVNSLNLQRSVIFVGEQVDVRPWLSTFDVAVLPSRREGLPNTLLEYLAMGRPVVATSVGAVPEVVEHDKEALLVPPGDSERLAAAIAVLLSSPQRRSELAMAGRRRVAKYGVDVMVNAHRDLYDRMLAEHRRTGAVHRSLRALAEAIRVRPLR